MTGKKVLLPDSILGCVKNVGARTNRNGFRDPAKRLARDIFKLESQDINRVGKLPKRGFVVIVGDRRPIGERRRRGILFGSQNMHTVATAAGNHRQHSSELTTAKDSDCLAGQYDSTHISESCKTWSRRSARYCSICSISSVRVVAKMRTANRPAFFAPAVPIASVATGTPPGICTIERSESSPDRALL